MIHLLDHFCGFWSLATSQRHGVFCHRLCSIAGLSTLGRAERSHGEGDLAPRRQHLIRASKTRRLRSCSIKAPEGPPPVPPSPALRRYHPLPPCAFNSHFPRHRARKNSLPLLPQSQKVKQACRSSDLTHFPIAFACR